MSQALISRRVGMKLLKFYFENFKEVSVFVKLRYFFFATCTIVQRLVAKMFLMFTNLNVLNVFMCV